MTLDAPSDPSLAPSPSPETALGRLVANVERAVLGKREAIELCVAALLAEGHVLIEDAPGTGKTTLARALARSIDLGFARCQLTSDLLPSDLVGASVWSQKEDRFRFERGPVFTNVLLADELNRTSPRTQSALLECMGERRVSVDGTTHELPRPFLVLATQNPLDFEGTYPLPESQLDRFLVRVSMGYPGRDAERAILTRGGQDPVESLAPVLDTAGLLAEIEATRAIRVDPALVEYALDLVERTREDGRFLLGASPRAALGWLAAARAAARIDGRDYVLPDDLQRLAAPTLAHRLIAAPMLSGEDGDARQTLAELIDALPLP